MSVLMPSAPSPAATAPATEPAVPAALLGWRPVSMRRTWFWTAMVTIVAAVTRLWSLGFPGDKIFDEVYYATEAQELMRFGYEDNRGYMFVVHPPLGKWAIALTSALFGNNSFGWRLAPALAGIASVVILTRVAMRMFRSIVLGVLAGLLLSLDGVSLVISRVALLDIFLQLFVIAGFAALLLDRESMRDRLADLLAAGVDLRSGIPSLGPRPWRLTAGVLMGCAFAVKWTALSFWVGFAGLSLIWDVGALASAGVAKPWRSVIVRSWLPGSISLGLAGVLTYLLTWVGWFTGANSWNRDWGQTHPGTGLFGLLPAPLRALLNYHHQAYQFHIHLDSGHPYKANPWSWLVLGRPILFYFPTNPGGCGASKCARSILLIGTPIMYWAFLPAVCWVAWRFITTRDWRAGVVVVAFVVGWGVWLQNTARTAFLFYMTPLIPFLVLGLTLAIGTGMSSIRDSVPPTQTQQESAGDEIGATFFLQGRLPTRLGRLPTRVRRLPTLQEIALLGYSRVLGAAVLAVWLGAVVADFCWMWPIYTGGLLTYDQWLQRMWFPSWI